MRKTEFYILFGFVNLLLSSQSYAVTQETTKIIFEKKIDLNQDGRKDQFLLEEDIKGNRNVKILVQDKNKRWHIAFENQNMILCRDCGGISTNDPIESIQVKRNFFEISQSGGSRERWTSTYSFQYSPKLKTWILKKAKLNVYDTVTNENTVKKEKINVPNLIKAQDFNYDRIFNNNSVWE